MTWHEVLQSIIFWSMYFGLQFFPPLLPIWVLPETFDPRWMV